MPSRRNTRTDAERTSALTILDQQCSATPAAKRPFPDALFQQLAPLKTEWDRVTTAVAAALGRQAGATARTTAAAALLDLLISHFFQVFNLGVARGEFRAADRTLYHLDAKGGRLPRVRSHAARRRWAENIVDGEAARQRATGEAFVPMSLPSAAQVAAALATYQEAYDTASTARTAYDLAQEAVAAQRPGANAYLREVWDEIEHTHRHEDAPSRRRKCRLWGVNYISRRGEPAEPDPLPAEPAPVPAPPTE